jgi:hypothetical protein
MTTGSSDPISEVRRAALAMGPLILEEAEEIERQRRLTPAVVEAMKQAGIFAIAMPKAWGGFELDLPEQLRILETLSSFDGSVGWCAAVGIGAGYASSWLSEEAGRELIPDVNSIFAGSALFAGKAMRIEGKEAIGLVAAGHSIVAATTRRSWPLIVMSSMRKAGRWFAPMVCPRCVFVIYPHRMRGYMTLGSPPGCVAAEVMMLS